MRCIMKVTQASAFGLIVVALLMSFGAPRHPSLLPEERLHRIVGTSKQFHVETTQSCDQEAAGAVGKGAVAWDECNANNANGNTICVQCSPQDGNPTNMI